MAIFEIPVARNLVEPMNMAMLFVSLNALMWIFSTYLLGNGKAPLREMTMIAALNGLAVLLYFVLVRNFLIEFVAKPSEAALLDD